MGINNSQITSSNYQKCKFIFELLCCNSLWIIHYNQGSAKISFTDKSILKHYLDKKYYLYDPNFSINPYSNIKISDWHITLGTDCETFHKAGFLYDLYKMFNIEEFASIEKQTGEEHYCFRFFTINNRLVFINKLSNNMPLIKYFIDDTIKEIGLDLNYTKLNHENKIEII